MTVRPARGAVLAAVVAAALLAPLPRPAGGTPGELARKIAEIHAKGKTATSRPAKTPAAAERPAPRRGKLYHVLKFTPAKPEQIRRNRERAQEWGRKIRETISKDLGVIETAHFLIYTTWARRDHAALAARCEAMYRALCREFNIPAARTIWAGKCPIFMFWKEEQFDAFTRTVDRRGAVGAGGYNVQTGDGFTYIVLNHTKTTTWFYEVLIHESTHAFLGRYLTNRAIPRWANEGLAEYMVAKLVKDCQANVKYEAATRLAVQRNLPVSPIFRMVRPHWFDYGIAQSLVRYLAATNRSGFIRFIQLIKEGKPESEALQEGMKLTHRDLESAWRTWARSRLSAPRPRPAPRRGARP